MKKEPCCEKKHEDLIGGLILIVIGAAFLLGNIYGISVWLLISTYWPVIIIIIGLSIILKTRLK
ncbi:MAG TPA: DUF5668 domain-containing protein [Candidatus Nanoarchaeia archaeon]|nr:DUF5668 domain-containing protein [Candidatus Nanoarchaeia archaeon]